MEVHVDVDSRQLLRLSVPRCRAWSKDVRGIYDNMLLFVLASFGQTLIETSLRSSPIQLYHIRIVSTPVEIQLPAQTTTDYPCRHQPPVTPPNGAMANQYVRLEPAQHCIAIIMY